MAGAAQHLAHSFDLSPRPVRSLLARAGRVPPSAGMSVAPDASDPSRLD